MELRPGYKQTEVGVLPEDWDISKASGVCAKIQDGTHFSPKLGGNDRLYVTSKNIRPGYLDLSTADRISEEEHRKIYRRCDVRYGDILLTKDGASTGNAALNNITEEFSLLSSVAVLRISKTLHSPQYFLQQILSSRGQHQIHEVMAGNAITRLTLEKIKKLQFPTPPERIEEEAIAEALSDSDALIESLEQLIAKKRQIKQGAMQELLTGKKRLPGFAGEWKIKLLPELSSFRGGKAHEQFIDKGGRFICVNSKFISSDGDVRKYSTANFCPAKKGDVLMVMSDLPNGKALAKVYLADLDDLYAVNQRVCAFTPAPGVSPQYLRYILNRNPYFLKFDDGVSQTHLLNRVFEKCPVPIPPTHEEQTAIATILSDMDADLASVEAKLSKARQLKQGMMQELLTGKIRLI